MGDLLCKKHNEAEYARQEIEGILISIRAADISSIESLKSSALTLIETYMLDGLRPMVYQALEEHYEKKRKLEEHTEAFGMRAKWSARIMHGKDATQHRLI